MDPLKKLRNQVKTRPLEKVRLYLLSGLLVSVPIFLTVYIFITFVTWTNNTVRALVPSAYRLDWYLPFHIPRVATTIVLILATLFILILIGAFKSGRLGTILLRVSEKIFNKTPVIRNIYSIIKQIFETLLVKDTKAFREVGLIEYPRIGVLSLCFITGITLKEIQESSDEEIINVFVPTTPNPTSGFLLFVPRGEVKVLQITVEDGLKLIISAGMVLPLKKGKS